MSDISFVRTEMVPEKAPPPSTVGIIGWIRANLFNGVLNSILSILAIIFLFMILKKVVPWVLSPTWSAEGINECRAMIDAAFGEGSHGHACWGVIRERWLQLIFGFYPSEQYWRPILAFILMFVALAPILFASVPRKLLLFSAAFPFLCFFLLWGGSIWVPISVMAGFVFGALAYKFAEKAAGGLAAGLALIFVPILWWAFLAGPVASVLSSITPWLALEQITSRQFGGFVLSITIGVTGIVLSLPLGIALALGRQSDLFILKIFSVTFIEFIRGVPLITLLFVASTLLNYFMPPGTNFDIILRVIIMVTLFAAAYMAEVIRGGLAALPKGQYEAADSLGLDYAQAQRLIIMPQALKIAIPGIVSTFIGLFKDTVLVSIIGLLDPVGLKTTINGAVQWAPINWEIYAFIGAIFFVLCFSMSRYSMYLERKLATGHR